MGAADRARILVVEDDLDVARSIGVVLERAGHAPAAVSDGKEAIETFRSDQPDLVILDVHLPAMDGWSVLRRIRDRGRTPVLLLTARGAEADKVRGLQGGADDYLTKPFANAELAARVAALLRRFPPERVARAPEGYDDGVVRVDGSRTTVTVDGRPVLLTPIELRLLGVLIEHRGQVLSPSQLLDRVWLDPTGTRPGRVRFAIANVRRKCGWSDPSTSPIATVRGFGYSYGIRRR